MKIYVDVILMENFIINVFLLYSTMKLTSHKYNMKRMFFAGTIGSLYTLVMIVPSLKLLSIFPIQIMAALSMVRVACGKKSIKDIIKISLVFFVSSFCLSGICFFIHLKKEVYILGETFYINNYSIKYSLLAMMILFIIISRIYDYIKEETFIKNYIFDIEFSIKDKKVYAKGFLDTGNSIKEPVTNLPCIILEKKLLKNTDVSSCGIYKIPYNTVSDNGFFNGIKVKGIKIKHENNIYKEIDAIICFSEKKLSSKNDFNALLPRGIV